LSLTVDRDRRAKVATKPVLNGYDQASRNEMTLLGVEERTKSFAEVRQGFTEEMAGGEGRRCLSCAASCIQACPYDAITFNMAEAKAQKCNLCYERVTHGLYPSCADNVCLAHCIYFGDPAGIAKTIEEKRKIRGGWGETIPKHLVFDE
jgi:ferredoxin